MLTDAPLTPTVNIAVNWSVEYEFVESPRVDKHDWNSLEDIVLKSAAVNESGDTACKLVHVKLVACLFRFEDENIVLA